MIKRKGKAFAIDLPTCRNKYGGALARGYVNDDYICAGGEYPNDTCIGKYRFFICPLDSHGLIYWLFMCFQAIMVLHWCSWTIPPAIGRCLVWRHLVHLVAHRPAIHRFIRPSYRISIGSWTTPELKIIRKTEEYQWTKSDCIVQPRLIIYAYLPNKSTIKRNIIIH